MHLEIRVDAAAVVLWTLLEIGGRCSSVVVVLGDLLGIFTLKRLVDAARELRPECR